MTRTWRELLRDESGVGDLKSVMVGVLAIMFITAASVLSVQGLIPWQQDRMARTAIEAIAPAQQSALNASGSYATLDELVSEKWLESKPEGVAVAKASDGTCWTAAVVSRSGKVMIDEGAGPVLAGGPVVTSECLDTTGIRNLVQQAGGPAGWTKVKGVLAPPPSLAYNPATRQVSWGAVTGATGYQVTVTCGSSLSSAPAHKAFLASTVRYTTVPAAACSPVGSPMLVNAWTTGSLDGTPTGRIAGVAANR